MPATTIKVDTSVRDRLARVAAERGMTMGALLAEITERLERESFFVTARHQLLQLRENDPVGWEQYRAESRAWQRGTDRDALRGYEDDQWWE